MTQTAFKTNSRCLQKLALLHNPSQMSKVLIIRSRVCIEGFFFSKLCAILPSNPPELRSTKKGAERPTLNLVPPDHSKHFQESELSSFMHDFSSLRLFLVCAYRACYGESISLSGDMRKFLEACQLIQSELQNVFSAIERELIERFSAIVFTESFIDIELLTAHRLCKLCKLMLSIQFLFYLKIFSKTILS